MKLTLKLQEHNGNLIIKSLKASVLVLLGLNLELDIYLNAWNLICEIRNTKEVD